LKNFINRSIIVIISLAISFLVLVNIFTGSASAASLKSLVFYGDTHSGYSTHQKIVAGIEAQNPAKVFHAGDLVSYKYYLYDWLMFDSITANLRAKVKYYPAIGNHDAYTGYFTQLFPYLPRGGRYYATTYSRLYIIVLDSNSSFKKDTYQYKWFKSKLKKARALGKTPIVMFHHPPVSSDGGEANPKYLLPLIKYYRVRFVFSGHYHHYERSYYNRTYFIVTGGGGATLYDLENEPGPYSKKYVKTYHFCRLDLEKDKIKLTVFDRDLNVIDTARMWY